MPVLRPLMPAGGEEALVARWELFIHVWSQAAIHHVEQHLKGTAAQKSTNLQK